MDRRRPRLSFPSGHIAANRTQRASSAGSSLPRRGGAEMSKRVLVAAPRSFCAGVVRAIDIVEKLLEQHGPPVYVRHEIVHNIHVVRDLEARGAVFVDSEDDVPEGALLVFSAHGVSPAVRDGAAARQL